MLYCFNIDIERSIMPSRRFAPMAGLAVGLLLDPAYAEDNTIELDTISVTSDDYESATSPVTGYRATRRQRDQN